MSTAPVAGPVRKPTDDEALKDAQMPKPSAGNDDRAIVVATFCWTTVRSRLRRPPIREKDPFFARSTVCVAATALVPAAPSPWNVLEFWLGSGAVAAAIGAYFGREIVGSGKEAGWIQARARRKA